MSMKANKEVLVKVERAPLAREEVLDEGLVELISIIVRLDRAFIPGDNAHRQVLVEVSDHHAVVSIDHRRHGVGPL